MKRVSMILVALAMMMSTAAFAQDGAALSRRSAPAATAPIGEGKMGPKIAGKSAADSFRCAHQRWQERPAQQSRSTA